MGKYMKKFLLLLSAALCLICCAGTSKQNFDFGKGKSVLWKVSDENSHVWILGSIHFADSSFYPLPQAVEQAFAESKALAAELDVSDGETVAETQAEMMKRSMLPQGRTLKQVLPDSLWAGFDSVCSAFGVPSQTFMQFRPWMAATLLSTYALMRTGIQSEFGIDATLLERASEQGKEIIALETPADQMDALASSDTSDAEGIYYLATTLDEIADMDSMIYNVTTAWKNGDIETLRRELGDAKPDVKNEHKENLEKRILDDRNEKMARNVEEFLASDREVFVVIGVAHLISGNNHVLKLLNDKGYKIERY